METPRELDYRFNVDTEGNFVIRITGTHPGEKVQSIAFTMFPTDARKFLEKGMMSLMAAHPGIFDD